MFGAWQLLTALQTSPSQWHDFAQDYIAAEDVLAGRNPFRPQNERVGELFNIPTPKEGPAYSFHPPTTIPFFLPLAPLPYAAAFVVWDLVQLALPLGDRRSDGAGARAAAVGADRCGHRPGADRGLADPRELRRGAAQHPGGGRHRRPAGTRCGSAGRGWRGVALALAVALKPLAGLFVLWALWRRQWRLLFAAGATLAVFTVVGVALSGVQGTIDYVTLAYPMHASLWPGYQDNASPQGLYTRLFGPSDWRPRPPYPTPGLSRILTLATWGVAVGLLFWRLGWRQPDAERLNREFAALGATMLLVTPIIWPHYYAVLIAPIAVFVAYFWQRRAWGWLGLLALALVVLWVPRDLHAWLERQALAPRAYGTFQLPALIAVYVVGLVCLGRRALQRPVAEP